jgi:phosphatidylinositol alpha-mannosyltransferase
MGAKLDSKLNIGFVLDTTLDTPDGVPQYVLGIGQWMAAQGHHVTYVVGESHRRDIPNILSMTRNITVRFNGNRISIPLPASKRSIRAMLEHEQFDVLHVQLPYSPFMAHKVIRAADTSTAVIGTFHILPINKISSIGTRLLSLWLTKSRQRFDKVVSVSNAAQIFSKQVFKMDSSVLPNVIDYQLFHNAQPRHELDDDVPTILFLGRLVPRKGAKLLLQAVNELVKDEALHFRVVLCGKGPMREELEAFVREHSLQSRVIFEGFVSEQDKPSYYASADIAVFPSSGGESFGIVLLEAMASGKAAVLAGDNPGYRSVMHERTDLLFTPTSKNELVRLLKKLLTDSQVRLQTAQWGERYATKFDTNIVGEQLLGIYQEALHKRRRQ